MASTPFKKIPLNQSWNFAPLVSFREGASGLHPSDQPSQIVAALGIRSDLAADGSIENQEWAFWRYAEAVGVPSATSADPMSIDQFFGWWEVGIGPKNYDKTQSGFASTLDEFGGVLLPSRVWQTRPNKFVPDGGSPRDFDPQIDTWQHFWAPCGPRWVEQLSDGSFGVRFSLRSACGLPTKDALPDHGGFELPLIIQTGITTTRGATTPFIKIGTPYQLTAGQPQWKEIKWQWKKHTPTGTAWWQRTVIKGDIKLFKEGLRYGLRFVHSDSDTDQEGTFWWMLPTSQASAHTDRGRVFTTYIDSHTISWLKPPGPGEAVRVTQTPAYLTGQPHLGIFLLEDGFIAQPTWRVSVYYPELAWAWLYQKLKTLWANWAETYLQAAASGLANDTVSFFPEFAEISQDTTSTSPRAHWRCKDSKGSDEEGLTFSVDDSPSSFRLNVNKATFPRVQGSPTASSADCSLLSGKLTFHALPRDIFGSPDVELFLTDKSKLLPESAKVLRDNAMQLDLPQEGDGTPLGVRGRIRAGWRPTHDCSAKNHDGQRVFIQISDVEFPVKSVHPIAQDATPEMRVSSLRDYEARDFRAEPLVICREKGTHGAGYRLIVNEAIRPPRTRNVALEIKVNFTTDPISLGERVIVLDPHPYTVAAAILPDFTFLNNAESGRVLGRRVYDADSGAPVWRLVVDTADPRRPLQLLFPPQAVGEEALLKQKTTKGDFYDMRLGACALVALESSYFEQRYAPVPWDLRWVLGRSGERDTGARVQWLHFELLYGLQTTFQADPRGIPIRLAEITSRLGDWPGGVPDILPWQPTEAQNNAFSAMRQVYGNLAKLFVARLGIFELGSVAFPEGVALSDGVSVRPRVAEGLKAGDPPRGAQLRLLPIQDAQYDPTKDIDKRILALHPSASLPDNTNGLPGGFEWGMQEWGLPWIRSFWKNDHSSSALVSRLALSALGGYGHQIARFMKDRILIEAHVGQGRANVYTVERVGRIAVFWNKAKHVIRYERSTVRAPEFDDQDFESGRPILRKVDEYIEILQDRREYPDQAAGQPIHTGPIKACVFPKVGYRIRIRGSWGRTLDNPQKGTGKWEVPLWQPGANPERFPKPEIHLELLTKRSAAETDKTKSALPANGVVTDELISFFQAIKHPEDVYFYTDGDEALGGDPGAWPPVMHVDFGDVFEPTENWQLPKTIDLGKAEFPDAMSIAPGMRRYSFRLEPAQDETVVTAHRQETSQVRGRMLAASMVRGLPAAATRSFGAGTGPEIVAAKAAQVPESDIIAARGDLGFGVSELVERVRKGQRPQAGQIEAEIRKLLSLPNDPVTHLPRPRKFQAPPILGVGVCSWTGGGQPPVLFYFLNKAVAHLRGRVEGFLHSRSEIIFARVERMRRKEEGRVDVLVSGLTEEIDLAIQQLKAVEPKLSFDLESVLRPFVEQLEHALSAARLQSNALCDAVHRHLGQAENEIEHWTKDVTAWEKTALDVRVRGVDALANLAAALNQLATNVGALAALGPWVNDLVTLVGVAAQKVGAIGLQFDKDFGDALGELTSAVGAPLDRGRTFLKKLRGTTETVRAAVSRTIDGLTFELQSGFVREIRAALQARIDAIQALARTDIAAVVAVLEALKTSIGAAANNVLAQVDQALAQARADRDQALRAVMVEVDAFITAHVCPIIIALCKLDLGLPAFFDAEIASVILKGIAVAESIEGLTKAIEDGNIDAVLNEAQGLANQLNHQLGYYTEVALDDIREVYQVARGIRDDAVGVLQEGESILRSARAVADAFTAPGLGFNRKTVALAYQTGDAIRKIGTTPIISKMKELNEHLNALGLNLPVSGLADRFLPDLSLPDFDFNQILKDLGGANLTGMFKGLKMPKELGDLIKVRHGVDKESMRAWVKADIDNYLLATQATVFAIGPVKVRVLNARLDAHVSMEVDIDRRMRKDARGSIKATWVLDAGAELVAFEDTQLIFDNGRMDFRIEPQKVRMSGLLKMLSDAAKVMSAEEDGFYVGLIKTGEIPVGMKAVLELPSISVGSTPVALNNLQIGGFLELRALDEKLRFNFTLGAGIHLSRKDSPFSVAIFCLGGGGWVDAAVRYTGSSGALESDISVGVDAAASLDINLGVVSGFVRISLGIVVEYHRHQGTGSQLLVGVRLVIEGRVDVLGIIEVYLALVLEGLYDGRKFLGRGTVKLRIKICWCFTLKVEKSVTYTFGGSGGGNPNAPAGARHAAVNLDSVSYQEAALNYLKMIE